VIVVVRHRTLRCRPYRHLQPLAQRKHDSSDTALIQARNRFMHAHAPCRGNTYKLTLSVGSACLAEPTSHFFHQVSIAALFTRRRSPPRWRFHRISLGRLFVERWQARQRFTLCEDASCRCRNASAAASWKCCVLHPARTSDKSSACCLP